MARDRHPDPLAAPVPGLCRDGQTLLGTWPLTTLPRLVESLFAAPAADERVSWHARFGQETPASGVAEPWLELEARTHVVMQCQRCLQALEEPLVMQRRFVFVATEAEAEARDAESDDDHLVMQPRLDLRELVEDELLLELPLVPRHAGTCPEPLAARPAAPDGDGPVRPNPFAVLAALRRSDPES